MIFRLSFPLRFAGVAVCVFLAACAAPGLPPEAPLYRCEGGLEFRARFAGDSVTLDGSGRYDVLYRDAGGSGSQSVYSTPRMRAEFGLGEGGREALVRYLLAPRVVRCVRD